jgi:hypothetical protein
MSRRTVLANETHFAFDLTISQTIPREVQPGARDRRGLGNRDSLTLPIHRLRILSRSRRQTHSPLVSLHRSTTSLNGAASPSPLGSQRSGFARWG